MKRIVNFAMAVAAFAVLGPVVPSARAQGVHCSNITLKGTYSATITGTLGGEPFAELDLITSTGNGTFSGTGTVSQNGVISTGVPVSATYTVNSDCSGSAVLSSGVTQNFNIKQDGSDVDIISTSSGTTITAVAKRLNDQNGD
ncbi:MAG TPA: hypothetical protein VG206_13185 [Terriglobia bacterium]|nr:hypothetical protein [Terriglobia bacterium]